MDLGFWILDFGSWILDFGSWILEFGFSLVFVLLVAAPNGPVWILEVWILGFGVWILDFGVGSVDTVWILHKIFPSHADSGRRIIQMG